MSELDKTLNDKNNTQDIPKILPMLPVRDIVVFPAMVLPLAVGRENR
jgi:ATP-dependent Lon protease